MDWKEAYRTGIREIDEQHKTLVEHISGIEQAVAKNEGRSGLTAAFAGLFALAQEHFIEEESLMQLHEFPELHEHANEHWRFLADMRALQEQSLNELSHAVDLLRERFDTHIQVWDKSYAFHVLKRLALGCDPSQPS